MGEFATSLFPHGEGNSKKKYSGATCRGCFILGTACGTCEKCIEELETMKQREDRERSKPENTYWVMRKFELPEEYVEKHIEKDVFMAIYNSKGTQLWCESIELIHQDRLMYREPVNINKGVFYSNQYGNFQDCEHSTCSLPRLCVSPPIIKKESHKDIMARRPKTKHYNTMEEFFDKYCAWEEDLKAVEEEI